MEFWAWADVLLGIGEEVVGACSCEVGAADLRRGECEVGGFGGVGGGEGVAH